MNENFEKTDLVQCIYASTEKEKFDNEQIVFLLEKVRKKF